MNNIPSVFWLIPIASVVALGMAWFFFRSMMNEDEGTDRMKEIAEHVRKGAMAYLKQQYKVVTIVFVAAASSKVRSCCTVRISSNTSPSESLIICRICSGDACTLVAPCRT